MNFWALKPDVFPIIEELFVNFLNKNCHSLTAEFYIPTVIQHLIDANLRKIAILTGNSQWFGMTYQSDRENTRKSIENLISQKVYPEALWQK